MILAFSVQIPLVCQPQETVESCSTENFYSAKEAMGRSEENSHRQSQIKGCGGSADFSDVFAQRVKWNYPN